MVGKRKFDEGAVLDAALRVFWQRGYSATNISDLETATGLSRGSIYQAFGDKEGLFVACLARYEETVAACIFSALKGEDGAAGIRGMMDAVLSRRSAPGGLPGCLLTNAAVERISLPRGAAGVAADYIEGQRQAIAQAVERADRDHQLRSGVTATQATELVLTTAQGIAVLERAGASEAQLRAAADATLRSLLATA